MAVGVRDFKVRRNVRFFDCTLPSHGQMLALATNRCAAGDGYVEFVGW